jgi:hypothetical protein
MVSKLPSIYSTDLGFVVVGDEPIDLWKRSIYYMVHADAKAGLILA